VRRIGGSDIAKLLGLSKYGNAMDVYLRVTKGEEDEWNPAMERGAAMEPVLRAHGQRMLGLELEDVASDYVDSPTHEFAHAQVDDLAHWEGQPVVVEYKSQSVWAKGWLPPDTIPEGYQAQVAWQLMCTERELALVVVGFGQDTGTGGFDIHNIASFEVQRDPVFEGYCVQVAREFWEGCVVPRRPPSVQPLGKKQRRAS
jgi:predicted phage-related endonuclease